MILLDKLSQRGMDRMGRGNTTSETASSMNNSPIRRPLTNTPASQRINQLPQRGAMGMQRPDIQQRFISDLPANVQIQGINDILSGKDTPSPIINNFVKGLAAQGKSPEEIRLAFIEHQKNSDSPLIMM